MTGGHDNRLGSTTPYALSRLSFPEVEQEIRRTGALIVPVGGCEPYSTCGALGVASASAEALGSALSAKMRIPVAPTVAFGCSTPYAAFGGAAGIKPRTLTNTVCEMLRQWSMQGFRTFVLIDALYENRDALDCAATRVKNSNPGCTIVIFSLQRDERVRAFIAASPGGKEYGRTEYGMLSLAAFIDPGLIRAAPPEQTAARPADAQRYRVWRKRGADPQQFKKYFPGCSGPDFSGRHSADFGRELFDYILKLLEESAALASRPRNP